MALNRETDSGGHRPRVCFVSLNCYNLIAQRDDIAHIGGAEVQQWLMAQWLLKQGYEVSFVTLDHGQPAHETVNGVSVCKAYDKRRGLPGLRFIHPRWSGVWSALKRADADVYYVRGGGAECGQVASWCKLNGKRFIFASANDSDCSRDLWLLTQRREKYLHRLGLSWCDGVITQSRRQHDMLQTVYGLPSTILRNCGKRPKSINRANKDSNIVLWVGRFSPDKRLEWLLDMAEVCGGYQFEIVGESNYQSAYAENLLERARRLPNVNLNGRVAHSEMEAFYSRCKLLCSTSIAEGFPNVYIEAWGMGIPVLASFDPDGVIQASDAGWVRGSVQEFIDVLQALSEDDTLWEKASIASQKHYDESHTMDTNMPVFEQVIGDVVRGGLSGIRGQRNVEAMRR